MDSFRKKSILYIEPTLQMNQVKTNRDGKEYRQVKSIATVFLTNEATEKKAITKTLLSKATTGLSVVTSTCDLDSECEFTKVIKQQGAIVDAGNFQRIREKRFFLFEEDMPRSNDYLLAVRKRVHVNSKPYNTDKTPYFKCKGTSIPSSIATYVTSETQKILESLCTSFDREVSLSFS